MWPYEGGLGNVLLESSGRKAVILHERLVCVFGGGDACQDPLQTVGQTVVTFALWLTWLVGRPPYNPHAVTVSVGRVEVQQTHDLTAQHTRATPASHPALLPFLTGL